MHWLVAPEVLSVAASRPAVLLTPGPAHSVLVLASLQPAHPTPVLAQLRPAHPAPLLARLRPACPALVLAPWASSCWLAPARPLAALLPPRSGESASSAMRRDWGRAVAAAPGQDPTRRVSARTQRFVPAIARATRLLTLRNPVHALGFSPARGSTFVRLDNPRDALEGRHPCASVKVTSPVHGNGAPRGL
jgi:hypothetical protein